MPILDLIQTNFSSGELSPRMKGRVDVAKYNNGSEKLENYIVFPQGGISRRSGTRHTNPVKDANKKNRLLPFQFSTTQGYILEFGDLYVRFYMNKSQIKSGEAAYEIASPYTEDDLANIWFTQSADVLYITCPGHKIKQLSRTGHTSWSFSDYVPLDGPYDDMNTTATTFTPSATTGDITITASTSIFTIFDIGRCVRLLHSNTYGWATITGYVSGTVVSATVNADKPFGGTTATKSWRLGLWSDHLGWPEICTFNTDQRLWFGASKTKPQGIWSSEVDNYVSQAPTKSDGTVVDSNALNLDLSTDQVNAIKWLMAGKDLSIGTSDGEFHLQPASANNAISPTNVKVPRENTFGSIKVKPVLIGSTILFAQKSGRKLYEYGYDYATDSFKGSDLTLLANHITKSGIKEVVYCQEPNNIIWICLNDGSLIGLTYLSDQKVFAWHRHPLGGTDAKVESIASILSTDGTHDQLWMIVSRTVNGSTVKYVEFLEQDFDDISGLKEDAYFVDSGLTYSGEATRTITGLEHLEGETVSILADGSVHKNLVVSGGEITLEVAASKVHVGLSYTSKLKTLPLEILQGNVSQLPKQKRMYKANIWFDKSLGGKVGFDEDSLQPIYFRRASNPMDSSPPLASEIKTIDFPKGWDKLIQVMVVQDQPLPQTILSIISEVMIGE